MDRKVLYQKLSSESFCHTFIMKLHIEEERRKLQGTFSFIKSTPSFFSGDPVNNNNLVGSFNPFEKYARQIGSSPQGSG